MLTSASARVTVNALRRLAERWQLTSSEVARLLGAPESAVQRMYQDSAVASLRADVRERIANLVVIAEDLATIFGPGEIADGWVRRPNAAFGNEPPLGRTASGLIEDLIGVRRPLDLACDEL